MADEILDIVGFDTDEFLQRAVDDVLENPLNIFKYHPVYQAGDFFVRLGKATGIIDDEDDTEAGTSPPHRRIGRRRALPSPFSRLGLDEYYVSFVRSTVTESHFGALVADRTCWLLTIEFEITAARNSTGDSNPSLNYEAGWVCYIFDANSLHATKWEDITASTGQIEGLQQDVIDAAVGTVSMRNPQRWVRRHEMSLEFRPPMQVQFMLQANGTNSILFSGQCRIRCNNRG